MALGLDCYGVAPGEGCFYLFCPDGRELKFTWSGGRLYARDITLFGRADLEFLKKHFENKDYG